MDQHASETTFTFYPPISIEPTPIIQIPATNQTYVTGNILALPKDVVLITMLFLYSSSQLEFAKTCTTLYKYYLEHLVVILSTGYPNQSSGEYARCFFERIQCYVGSNHFLQHHFIRSEKLKYLQS